MIIRTNSSSQLEVIGKVQITTTFCASDADSNNAGYNPADPSCQGATHKGNADQNAQNNWNIQRKIAYRVPNGTTAPSSFTSTNTSNPPTTPCGGGVTFNENTSYANAIEALSSSGANQKWVGYLSTVSNYTHAGCQYTTVAPQFTLNQGFGVAPFEGPFDYRVVVGFRQVDEGTPGNTSARAVTCGSNLYATYLDGVDGADGGTDPDMTGICIDDPNSSTVATDLSQTTRDLGVIPPGNTSINAGQTANLNFNLSYKGAALPSGQFNITANTTIPGATATPSITSLVPAANSDTSVNVSVPVPAGTSPGTYSVFVVATLSTNPTQTRGSLIGGQLMVGEAFGFNTSPDVPNMPSVTLNGQAQTKTAQMANFSVIDSPGSSDQGWNVTVVGNNGAGKSNVFKQYCPGPSNCGSHPPGYVSGGFTLPANSLTLNTTGASWTGGTGSAPTFSCNSGCSVDRATAIKIASAPNGGGTALWSTNNFSASSLSLATASTLRALPASEQYRADVVWTLGSGP